MIRTKSQSDDRQTLSSSMSNGGDEDAASAVKSSCKMQSNVPPKYLASIFLSFGFLLIWSAVLAAVIIGVTVKSNEKKDELSLEFETQKKLNDASFVIGKELVTTINILMKNDTDDTILANEVLITHQRETDKAIEKVGHPKILRPVLNQLEQIRYLVKDSKDPNEAIELYYKLNEELMRLCMSFTKSNHELLSPTLGFVFLNQGMIKKFEELALSSIYLKKRSFSSSSFMTQLFSAHAQSNEYLKSSFNFVPKSKACWWELGYSNEVFLLIVNAISLDRNNRQIDIEPKFNEFNFGTIKVQLKNLRHIKRTMLKLFDKEVKLWHKNSNNVVMFHMSLAITAFVVIAFSIVIIGFSLKEFSRPKPIETAKNNVPNSMMVCLDEKNSLPNTYVCSPTFNPVITASGRPKSVMC